MTTRRKLAIASWRAPHEPNIYGKLTVDAGPALKYLEDARRKSGEKITMTHFVGKATAEARVLKWGRSTCFIEAELFDPSGALVAKASATQAPKPFKRF